MRTTLVLLAALAALPVAAQGVPGTPVGGSPGGAAGFGDSELLVELKVYRTWQSLPKALKALVEKDAFKASMVGVGPGDGSRYALSEPLPAGAPIPGSAAVYDLRLEGSGCGPCRGVHVEGPRARPEKTPPQPTVAYVIPKAKGRVFLRTITPRCPPCTAP